MATIEQFQRHDPPRGYRYFSTEFKRKKVEELDKKLISISELCKEYQVSAPAVYKWIYKYSLMRKKGVKMVVEAQSDTARIKALKDHIAALELLVGKQQFTIDFMEKQMQIASDQYGVDFKKKLSIPASPGFGKAKGNTATK